ncbi:hypothetical protein [Nisaea sp.]|uniref:hypothetical protein n=1 Tax=Nisaea sp. TaxID=2024842 RepID=UPI003B5259F4
MKRGLLVAALPLLLGGCLPILPPAIQLATTGLSGIAFMATGKSTTDHLLSAAVDEDCSLLRVAFGDEPCHEYASDDQKPLTEIVAYYPGDGDDWIDHASIPAGTVSGKTMLTMSADVDPDVRGRENWPGRQESETLLVEAAAENEDGGRSSNVIDAGLESLEDLSVAGFVPVAAALEPEPLALKSVVASSEHLLLPVSADVSWKVEPQAREALAGPAADPEPTTVETSARATMTVLPVLRPVRAVPGEPKSHVVENPSEIFAETGLAGTNEAPREAAEAILLHDRFASNQGIAAPSPVIMSVRLKGNLLQRVTGGAFAGYDAMVATSSFEPVFGLRQ